MIMEIDPLTDQLVFVRFKNLLVFELVVRNAAGAWIWYEAAFCRRDQKMYLLETEIGQPAKIPVYCHDEELAGIFWADGELVPESCIDIMSGGLCIRLLQLPAFLQEESFQAFCAGLGYANEMVPCVCCQDVFPISGNVPEESQQPCPHIHWCPACGMFSSPYFPGKEEEMEQCSHRTADDLYYAGANTP
jgi:hypothetical protein